MCDVRTKKGKNEKMMMVNEPKHIENGKVNANKDKYCFDSLWYLFDFKERNMPTFVGTGCCRIFAFCLF